MMSYALCAPYLLDGMGINHGLYLMRHCMKSETEKDEGEKGDIFFWQRIFILDVLIV